MTLHTLRFIIIGHSVLTGCPIITLALRSNKPESMKFAHISYSGIFVVIVYLVSTEKFTVISFSKGLSAPNPDLLFVLTQKVSKKVKTAPASLEKLALVTLKSPNSSLRSSNSGYFYASLTCFSAHRTRSEERSMTCSSHLIAFLCKENGCTS